jgi:hypothetical protein
MNRTKVLHITRTLTFASLWFAAAGSLPAANILLNPGFESGSLASWTNSGWFVGGSGYLGSFSAITGCVGPSCITTPDAFFSQAVATTVGQNYSLSFWFSNNDAPGNHLQVRAGGVVLSDLIDQPGDNVWRQETLSFIATAASTSIEFRGRNDPAGLVVDDICLDVAGGVCASSGGGGGTVPEPGTWATAGAALLALTAFGRRIRRLP